MLIWIYCSQDCRSRALLNCKKIFLNFLVFSLIWKINTPNTILTIQSVGICLWFKLSESHIRINQLCIMTQSYILITDYSRRENWDDIDEQEGVVQWSVWEEWGEIHVTIYGQMVEGLACHLSICFAIVKFHHFSSYLLFLALNSTANVLLLAYYSISLTPILHSLEKIYLFST